MKHRNHKRLLYPTGKSDIVINFDAWQVVKFLKYIFGWRARKRQRKINKQIQLDRLKHIEEQHRLHKDH